MHWDVLQSSVIPQARTNEYETYRAAPTCVPRRCQEERESSRRGAIHWSAGASLAISSACVLFGHPVLEERGGKAALVGLISIHGEVQDGAIHWTKFG